MKLQGKRPRRGVRSATPRALEYHVFMLKRRCIVLHGRIRREKGPAGEFGRRASVPNHPAEDSGCRTQSLTETVKECRQGARLAA